MAAESIQVPVPEHGGCHGLIGDLQFIPAIEYAISALARHGHVEAAECLNIELILYRAGSVCERRLRQTANAFLSILAK
jgi:hypothetical protein